MTLGCRSLFALRVTLALIAWGYLAPNTASAGNRVGILFGSYGDIDDSKTELRPFIRNTLTDPDVLPLPAWLRATIADAGWYIERSQLYRQYAAIGERTGTRQTSRLQADAVATDLKHRGYDAVGYVGFTMTTPFVRDALDQARADAIDQMIVFYQGAQYSHDTTQILFRHVRDYLKKHPDWNVNVIGVRSFSDDPRYIELIENRLQRQLNHTLAAYAPQEICIYLTAHGNVTRLDEQGDPYASQVMRLISGLRERFKESPVYYGFHNHDEIPVVKWSSPSNAEALPLVAKDACKAVVINGQISFTVDNLETLYNQLIEAPYLIRKAEAEGKRAPKAVIVDRVFNLDRDFIALMTDVAEEAMDGKGDILRILPQ